MVNRGTTFNRRRIQAERRELPMGFMQINHHQIKGRCTGRDIITPHEQQMRTTTHFIDRHIGAVKYWAHPNQAHELRSRLHLVCFQYDVCYTDQWSLLNQIHVSLLSYRCQVNFILPMIAAPINAMSMAGDMPYSNNS
jgi:hypothetical protein